MVRRSPPPAAAVLAWPEAEPGLRVGLAWGPRGWAWVELGSPEAEPSLGLACAPEAGPGLGVGLGAVTTSIGLKPGLIRTILCPLTLIIPDG